MKQHLLFPTILLTCFAVASTAKANLTFADNPNETITVTMGYSIYNNINGSEVPSGTSQTFAEGGTIAAYGIWNSDTYAPGSYRVYFTEENNPAMVSDILNFTIGQVYIYGGYNASIYATFQSFGTDAPLSSFILQTGDQVRSEADGTFQFGLLVDTYYASVTFPSGNETVVPEPSTFIAGALLALPFGLQGVRRLRNRKPVV